VQIKNKILTLIKNKLNVKYINIDDFTQQHRNHTQSNNGGHFKLTVVSDDFINISLIERHKKIYSIVNKMLKKEIHALSIQAYSETEFTQVSNK